MECEAVRQDVVHLDILGILGVIYPHSSHRYPRWIGIPFMVFTFGTAAIILSEIGTSSSSSTLQSPDKEQHGRRIEGLISRPGGVLAVSSHRTAIEQISIRNRLTIKTASRRSGPAKHEDGEDGLHDGKREKWGVVLSQ